MPAAKLDPRKMDDWQIAHAAEEDMKPIRQVAEEFGLDEHEYLPEGIGFCKVDQKRILDRLSGGPRGKYIDITAITPTPLGEGKSTTSIGLIQGLGTMGKKVSGAIRQPSSAPTFNIKGSAAGGGLSQCIPLAPFSLGLSGDIDAVTNAHNLGMVALTARMQHERNYSDEQLERRNLVRLDIDPHRIDFQWVMDYCAQSLRNITIGKGGRMDGFKMESGFSTSVASELMAILAICHDLKDMRDRISRIVVAHTKKDTPVTTAHLDVDGAMAAWMLRAINPTLMQTIEGQPVLVHAGPFANIAVGQSSIIADRVGLHLSDYHITESGFGADIGYEKFWNIKCRYSGLKPNAVVIVATVRALKMHGGGPVVIPGRPLPREYTQENIELLERGFDNLAAHIETVKKSGVHPVVCVNRFPADTDAELEAVRTFAESQGARAAVAEHWMKGGEGAVELAEQVIEACEEEHEFTFLYNLGLPIKERILMVAKEVYGADGVDYKREANKKIEELERNPASRRMPVCMVKTHLSLSHNPDMKGRPVRWRLPVRDVLTYMGAGYIVPVAGDIKLMPGTSSNPAFRRIDIDTEKNIVTGLQ